MGKWLLPLILFLAGCQQVSNLPPARNSDGSIYIAPICLQHEKELWDIDIPVILVRRDSFWLLNGAAQGRYMPEIPSSTPTMFTKRRIYILDSLLGWYKKEVELHERCHAWLDITTGNPIYHR